MLILEILQCIPVVKIFARLEIDETFSSVDGHYLINVINHRFGKSMKHILIYGDSLTWGIIPQTRRRLPFEERWPGVLEAQLIAGGKRVRVIEDCLNGRRTVWDDPFKPGRNGLHGIGQRIEANSPLALVIVMLGTNDFLASHQIDAYHSAQGLAAIIRAIRAAPIEPGLPIPPILIVSPPVIRAPKGAIAAKFSADAEVRCRGIPTAQRQIATEEGCAYFDAASVTTSSVVDGVHLDADQHKRLGQALAGYVTSLLFDAEKA
jgi:lysophospholipase L1-like esterase